MGDNIYLGDRNGVRTPMQWSSDRNGGFSRADPARLFAPPIMDPVYGYQAINVEAQERYPFSPLNWMKRLIAMRKQHRVSGRGSIEFVGCSNRKMLGYLRRDRRETIPTRGSRARAVLERQALRPFLQRQRWFASKSREIRQARFSDWTTIRTGTTPAFVSVVSIEYTDGRTESYLVPLALVAGEDAERALKTAPAT